MTCTRRFGTNMPAGRRWRAARTADRGHSMRMLSTPTRDRGPTGTMTTGASVSGRDQRILRAHTEAGGPRPREVGRTASAEPRRTRPGRMAAATSKTSKIGTVDREAREVDQLGNHSGPATLVAARGSRTGSNRERDPGSLRSSREGSRTQ